MTLLRPIYVQQPHDSTNSSNNNNDPPSHNKRHVDDDDSFNPFSIPISIIVLACGTLISHQAISSSRLSAAPSPSPPTVSVIIPALNEEKSIFNTLEYLKNSLNPPPYEIIVADGGSTDRTVAISRQRGARVVRSCRGRGRQMNTAAKIAKGDVLMFVHADSKPPSDAVKHVWRVLNVDPGIVLGAFFTVIENPHTKKPMYFSTFHNFIKTYYAPLLFKPLSFLRGMRCCFGDQTLFCRKKDFERVGGYDDDLPIMEDADLCTRLHEHGREDGKYGREVQILSAVNRTSGRRIHHWGNLKATLIQFYLGLRWFCGASAEELWNDYDRIYTDLYR